MSNSTSIYRCLNCEEKFCSECTDASAWTEFCSADCEKKWELRDAPIFGEKK